MIQKTITGACDQQYFLDSSKKMKNEFEVLVVFTKSNLKQGSI